VFLKDYNLVLQQMITLKYESSNICYHIRVLATRSIVFWVQSWSWDLISTLERRMRDEREFKHHKLYLSVQPTFVFLKNSFFPCPHC